MEIHAVVEGIDWLNVPLVICRNVESFRDYSHYKWEIEAGKDSDHSVYPPQRPSLALSKI